MFGYGVFLLNKRKIKLYQVPGGLSLQLKLMRLSRSQEKDSTIVNRIIREVYFMVTFSFLQSHNKVKIVFMSFGV